MKKINLTNTISVLALLISILSIYFSVFYKNHDPTVSIIDSKIDLSSNTIKVDLLFYNKGNSYATVISKYLLFYQDNDWENKGIIFVNGKPVYNAETNPIILKPDEQILKEIESVADFKKMDNEYSRKLNFTKKIKIGLVTEYINSSGLRTSELFKIGYIFLDKNKMIEKYRMNYESFSLNSWDYYGSAGND
jgi:hypothetical protein